MQDAEPIRLTLYDLLAFSDTLGPPNCNCAINDHKSSKRDESKQDPSVTQSLPQAPRGCLVALNSASIFSEMVRSSTGSSSMTSPTQRRRLLEDSSLMQELISTTGGTRQFDDRFDLFGDGGEDFWDKMVAFKIRRRPSLARNLRYLI
ncbi:hypothetical protein MJO29_015278 [Puccinia striiformis f. sp. tritici]|nr:hypothetical protein MJO29_015278 [Puccinia striiformis f. sp. tritici]